MLRQRRARGCSACRTRSASTRRRCAFCAPSWPLRRQPRPPRRTTTRTRRARRRRAPQMKTRRRRRRRRRAQRAPPPRAAPSTWTATTATCSCRSWLWARRSRSHAAPRACHPCARLGARGRRRARARALGGLPGGWRPNRGVSPRRRLGARGRADPPHGGFPAVPLLAQTAQRAAAALSNPPRVVQRPRGRPSRPRRHARVSQSAFCRPPRHQPRHHSCAPFRVWSATRAKPRACGAPAACCGSCPPRRSCVSRPHAAQAACTAAPAAALRSTALRRAARAAQRRRRGARPCARPHRAACTAAVAARARCSTPASGFSHAA